MQIFGRRKTLQILIGSTYPTVKIFGAANDPLYLKFNLYPTLHILETCWIPSTNDQTLMLFYKKNLENTKHF